MGIKSTITSVINKITSTAKKIGPAIQQGGTYGGSINVGGIEVTPTGPGVTTTGITIPSGATISVAPVLSGGGGGGRRASAGAEARREIARAERARVAREATRQVAENRRIQIELQKRQALERQEAIQRGKQQRETSSLSTQRQPKFSTITTMDTPRGKDTIVIKDATGRFVRDATADERKRFRGATTEERKRFRALKRTEEFGREISERKQTREQQFQVSQQAGQSFLLGGGQPQKDITQIFGGRGINLQPAFDRAGQRIDTALVETGKFVFTKPKSFPEVFSGDVKTFFEKPSPSTFVRAGAEVTKTILLSPFAIIKEASRKASIGLSKQESKFGKVASLGIGGVGVLTPVSLAEVGLLFGGGAVLSKAAPVVRATAGITFGTIGTVTALDTSLTPEQRVAGGIIAVGGFTGAGFELAPFFKGGVTRLSKGFKPVKTGQVKIDKVVVDAKFIKVGKSDLMEIGLIPEAIGTRQGKFPAGAGALQRGGFGFPKSEQIKGFSGKKLRLTTSQANIEIKNNLLKQDAAISDVFFLTAADPVTQIPQTRISRLGLSDFFKRPKGDISLSITGGGQPKIIVTEPVKIGGKKPRVKIAPKGSTGELEVTTKENIKILEDLGATVLKGQRVNLLRGELIDSPVTNFINKARVGDIIPSKVTSPSISTISVGGGTIGLGKFPKTFTLTGTASSAVPSGSISTFISKSSLTPITKVIRPTIKLTPIVPRRTSGGISRRTPTVSIPTIITPPPSRPPSTPTRPIIPPIKIPTPPSRPPPTITRSPIIPIKKQQVRFPQKIPKSIVPKGKGFIVEVRRFGIFRPVGVGKTVGQALAIGKNIVGKSLARSFRITGAGISKVPGFRTKKEKGGFVFIEPSKRALSARTEVEEIFSFKRKAPKKKKKLITSKLNIEQPQRIPLFFKKKDGSGYGFI